MKQRRTVRKKRVGQRKTVLQKYFRYDRIHSKRLYFVFLILHFVGQRTVVNGNSMDTTLANGQNLVMDKLSYRFHDPKRYDIIIFPTRRRRNASVLY